MDLPLGIPAMAALARHGMPAILFLGLAMSRSLAQEPERLPPYLRPEALASEQALRAVSYGASPDVVYGAFNTFVKNVFGAEADPLIYERFGQDLRLLDSGFWLYASERSAVIGWESNLPATSHVEFGLSADLGRSAGPTDRHYFLHIHHLADLEPGQTYHYRFVGIDERGNRLDGPIQTFRTQDEGSMIPIGGDHEDGPIIIDAPGRYVLVRDIVSTTRGIEIEAENVTLDLGGHTLVYATQAVPAGFFEDEWTAYDQKGPFGIRNWLQSGFTLLNGTIRQGDTGTWENTGNDDTSGFNPLYIRGAADVHVAGVVVDYHSRQNTGIMNRGAKDNHLFHHNIIRDRGAIVRNRHGPGCRAIHFYADAAGSRNHLLHHNLVARSRQNGLNLGSPGGHLHSNEVYIDSWATNSFAMGVPDGEDEDDAGHHGNRIFATGFNPYGFGWASRHLRIHGNFIYMHGLDLSHRWYETWGDINLLAALRVTNYSGGGQERNDLLYRDNLIILRAKQGADIQGTRFFSDTSIEGLVLADSTIKTERLDSVAAPNSGAIVAHGYYLKNPVPPVVYRDSTLISNEVLVQFGEAYARGNNHQFDNVRFVRFGERPGFATFRFGGQYHNRDHVIANGTFEGGAAFDDVYWDRTGAASDYHVRWTLTLEAPPQTTVSIINKLGLHVFSGTVGDDGLLAIPLTHCRITPTATVSPKDAHLKELHTPHSVTATYGGQTVVRQVEMTQPRHLHPFSEPDPARAFLPYQQHWEDFEVGESPLGQEGWHGDNPAHAVVASVTPDYLHAPPPLTPPAPGHAKALRLDTGRAWVSNALGSAPDYTNAVVDKLVQLVALCDGDALPLLAAEPDAQLAYFLGTNGWLTVWHQDRDAPTNRLTVLDQGYTSLAADEWARITIEVDYRSCPLGGRFFRVALHGQPFLTHPQASTRPHATEGGPGGSWFLCANQSSSADRLEAVLIRGKGFLDDYSVSIDRTVVPVPAGHSAGGVPFAWYLHHGLAPGQDQNWDDLDDLDADGDGSSNREEYLAGSDPNDPGSVLALVAIALDDDAVRLIWNSHQSGTTAPRRYRVMASDGPLADAETWSPIADNLPPAGPETTWEQATPPAAQRFYRIGVAVP